jgi:hypothetical protein
MIEVNAEKPNDFDDGFTSISICRDNIKIVLNKEESKMLVETLAGKRGVITTTKRGEYEPHTISLFSTEGSFKYHLIEE